MAHGYKLIGMVWDRLPASSPAIEAVSSDLVSDPGVGRLGDPVSLFDSEQLRRQVSVSELLGICAAEEFIALAFQARECDQVTVLLDYAPQAKGDIARDFWWKRLGQINFLLQIAAPEVEFLWVAPACLSERLGELDVSSEDFEEAA